MGTLPLPFSSLILALVLLPLALLIPPNVLSKRQLAGVFLPLIWSCHIYCSLHNLGYLAIIHGLWSTELLLWRNPREEFSVLYDDRRGKSEDKLRDKDDDEKLKDKNDDDDDDERKEEEKERWRERYPEGVWERVKWVLKLIFSPRYHGFSTSSSPSQPKPPPSPPISRLQYLLTNLLLFLLSLTLSDLTNLYTNYDPYFQISTPIDEALPHRLSSFLSTIHLSFLPPRILRMLIMGISQYVSFSGAWSFICLFFVGPVWPVELIVELVGRVIGFGGGERIEGEGQRGRRGEKDGSGWWTNPQNWKPLMGNPWGIVRGGLRGFWGGVWQDLLRVILTGPGKALVKAIGIKRRSALSYGIQTLLAFTISGVMHTVALPSSLKTMDKLWFCLFFAVQGICVCLEVGVSSFVEGRVRGWKRGIWVGLRFIWAVGVMVWTVPWIAEVLVGVGKEGGVGGRRGGVFGRWR